MLSKSKISEIKALRNPKNRRQEGLFIVEGEKVVNELLNSDFEIDFIAGTPLFIDSLKSSILNSNILVVSESELERISALTTPNKVLAVAKIPTYSTVDFNRFIGPALILDGINDPGNLGTIIRTAEWFGVKAIFCSPNTADCFNAKVVQSAMGSLFRVPVYYSDLIELISKIKTIEGFNLCGAVLNGNHTPLVSVSREKAILIVGSESHGISSEVEQFLDFRLTIASAPGNRAESLNAAVACGVILSTWNQS